jgi:hypothetical protein
MHVLGFRRRTMLQGGEQLTGIAGGHDCLPDAFITSPGSLPWMSPAMRRAEGWIRYASERTSLWIAGTRPSSPRSGVVPRGLVTAALGLEP